MCYKSGHFLIIFVTHQAQTGMGPVAPILSSNLSTVSVDRAFLVRIS